jgi:hypothetical protein
VLLARRNLPWLLAGLYLLNWVVLMLVRERSAHARRPWFAGFDEGRRADPGQRGPVS